MTPLTKKAYREFTDQEVIEALEKAKGIVSIAAEHLGCSRQAVYERMNKSKEIMAAHRHVDESVTDFAETKLMQKISQGDMRAILFRLETKGKNRGYVKRQEIDGPEGQAIPVSFTLEFNK
jgi:Bacterial regulatory protein, Fis family